jgi:anti-anti-sigma factor
MEGSRPFALSVRSGFLEGCHVLVVEGELDMDHAPELDAAIETCSDGLPLVIDLTSLAFIDSTGIHTLLRDRDSARPVAVVRAPDSNVARVLDIVDAESTLPVFDDLASAVRQLGTNAAEG